MRPLRARRAEAEPSGVTETSAPGADKMPSTPQVRHANREEVKGQMGDNSQHSKNAPGDLADDPWAPTGMLIPDILRPARPFLRTYSFDLLGFFGTWLLVAALLAVTIVLARIGA